MAPAILPRFWVLAGEKERCGADCMMHLFQLLRVVTINSVNAIYVPFLQVRSHSLSLVFDLPSTRSPWHSILDLETISEDGERSSRVLLCRLAQLLWKLKKGRPVNQQLQTRRRSYRFTSNGHSDRCPPIKQEGLVLWLTLFRRELTLASLREGIKIRERLTGIYQTLCLKKHRLLARAGKAVGPMTAQRSSSLIKSSLSEAEEVLPLDERSLSLALDFFYKTHHHLLQQHHLTCDTFSESLRCRARIARVFCASSLSLAIRLRSVSLLTLYEPEGAVNSIFVNTVPTTLPNSDPSTPSGPQFQNQFNAYAPAYTGSTLFDNVGMNSYGQNNFYPNAGGHNYGQSYINPRSYTMNGHNMGSPSMSGSAMSGPSISGPSLNSPNLSRAYEYEHYQYGRQIERYKQEDSDPFLLAADNALPPHQPSYHAANSAQFAYSRGNRASPGQDDYSLHDDEQDEEEENVKPLFRRRGGVSKAHRNQPAAFQQIFGSQEEYLRDREGRNAVQNPSVNNGFGKSDSDLHCVRQLFDAIKAVGDVIDKPCKNNKPAQAVQRLISNYYPNKEIEAKCWEILIQAKKVSAGHNVVESHHNIKREGNSDYYADFHARWQAIVRGCQHSKAMCKQILDPPFIDRLVEAPHAEFQMKENNKKINTERDIQNEIGRKAVKHGGVIDDLDIDVFTPEAKARILAVKTSTPIKKEEGERFSYSGLAVNTPKKPLPAATPKKSLATPTATSIRKRKTRNTHVNSSDEFDEGDNDDSDGNYENSARKSLTKRRNIGPRQAIPNQRLLELASSPTPKRNARQKGVKTLPRSSTTPMRRQPARVATISQNLSPVETSDESDESFVPPANPTEEDYKKAICNILKVDEKIANEFELRDLRLYARAYNQQFKDEEWYHKQFRNLVELKEVGVGPMVQTRKTGQHNGPSFHLAQKWTRFRSLALARGDVNLEGVAQNGGAGYFETEGDEWKDAALGVIQNKFGYHDNLYNNPPQ
ncbi:hypothetical protein G7Y89_g2423 [Cudoniella acicularis]|uniref:Uncharacterized protein n=1 Tax=Cudoniella acicularis TaxID=354080 RepID=A0A8H4RV39_9HELO|nr:hypothetical protein G7Y89_g2423 [Cudoniella acicularis]